jgi:hypothetical protein
LAAWPAGRRVGSDAWRSLPPGRSPSTAAIGRERLAARHAARLQRYSAHGPRSAAPEVRISQTRSSFSGGHDQCKTGILTDRAGSGVVVHPPSPREVVVHVAGPRWPGFLAATTTSTTPRRCVAKAPRRGLRRNVMRQAGDPWRKLVRARETGRRPGCDQWVAGGADPAADCFGKLILLGGSVNRTEIGPGGTGAGHGLLLHDRLGGIWEVASGANRPEPVPTELKQSL